MTDLTDVAYEDAPQELKDGMTKAEYDELAAIAKKTREMALSHG